MKITLNIISVMKQYLQFLSLLESLSKDVFERRMSIGSEAFSIFICLDADKFVLPSFFSLIKTIYPRVSTKPLPNDAKSPLPADVRRSKTLLLKLPNICMSLTWSRFKGLASASPSNLPLSVSGGSLFCLCNKKSLLLSMIAVSVQFFKIRLWNNRVSIYRRYCSRLCFV